MEPDYDENEDKIVFILYITRKLRLLINGKSYDKIIEMILMPSIRSLNRLKSAIAKYLKVSLNIEKMKIYNYKGIEIDDADIEYLKHHQTLFLSLEGASFSVNNYVNEYKFIKWIKSGGYGKVYLGKVIT